MKLNYEKLIKNLDYSNFVIFNHQARSLNFVPKEGLIELMIPN